MKKVFFITSLLIILSCFTLIKANNYSGSKTVVAYVQQNNGSSFYAYGTFGIDIGYKYVSQAQESETARTKFTFDLSNIPGNATITSVSLSYSVSSAGNSSYKFTITQINNYSTPQDIWQNIGNALFSDISYNSGSLSSSTLTSTVNSSKGSNMYLGALSQNESNYDSYANLGLTLSVSYTVPPTTVTITVDNNFTDNSGLGTHGQVSIDGTTQTVPSSGVSLTRNVGQNLTLSAISPQQDNQGYQKIWHTGATNTSDWTRSGVSKNLNQTYSFAVAADDGGTTYTANLRKICQATFVKPDGNTTQNVIEGNTASAVTAPSMYTSSDWIYYNFVNWTWSGGSSTNTTITPTLTAHTTYTANYTATTANPQPMNIHFTSTDGQYISLAWTEHPSTGVTQYQVWRMIKGGTTSAIATLNRGTTSFTDYAYIQNNAGGTTNLFYTVKAYYAPSGLWNDPGYYSVSGDGTPRPSIVNNDKNQLNELGKETPAEYSIGNYPNPFNPTTTIDYQLPENGFVTIKVYDILGKEVTTLVNENKSAGYYQINFDASRLTSGVYIYTINVNGFAQSKKMLLMK